MGSWIITMVQEEVIQVKITIGIGVGQMRDRPGMEEIVEVQALVDQDLVQGQVQIGIELDALSVGNMITLQGNVQLGKQVGKQKQMQQMFNMDEDQTILQTLLMDTDQDEQTITPVETSDNLNL